MVNWSILSSSTAFMNSVLTCSFTEYSDSCTLIYDWELGPKDCTRNLW